jgi:hypothetical protein
MKLKYVVWLSLSSLAAHLVLFSSAGSEFQIENRNVLEPLKSTLKYIILSTTTILWPLGCIKCWPISKVKFFFSLFYFPVGIYYSYKIDEQIVENRNAT